MTSTKDRPILSLLYEAFNQRTLSALSGPSTNETLNQLSLLVLSGLPTSEVPH